MAALKSPGSQAFLIFALPPHQQHEAMNHTTSSASAAVGHAVSSAAGAHSTAASAAALEKQRQEYYASQYPIQVWYLVVSFLFLVAACQYGSWLLGLYTKRRVLEDNRTKRDAEIDGPTSTGRSSYRRIPEAIAGVYRVVAFRWTITFGGAYTLNLAEVLVTCVYIIALFTWNFIRCTCRGIRVEMD